jgi:dolichol-phosphate mannosyltransferase
MTAARASISIAIPAYNEIDTLERATHDALAVLARHADDYEVLIVDDGSIDGTSALADRVAAEIPHVRVIHHAQNRGFSGAMRTCLWEARKELIVLGPADGQARFEQLAAFLHRIDDYDLLFGRRTNRVDSPYRKLGSFVWYAYLKLLFGTSIPEFSALFLFRRAAIQTMHVPVRDRGANMLPALFLLARVKGFRVGTVDAPVYARVGGHSKGGGIGHALLTMAEDLQLWWRWRVRS